MSRLDGRQRYSAELRKLRAQSQLTVAQIAAAADELAEAARHRRQSLQRARGLRIDQDPGRPITRTSLNGWLNEGKVPEWEQLWAVVQVLATAADRTDRTGLEARWRKLRSEALATPATPSALDVPEPARPGVVVGRVPEEPAHFIVREQLRDLRDWLMVARVAVVVTGMRGIGKTQLAAAYVREIRRGGAELVGWVDAGSADAMLADLAAIAERLGVADPRGDSARSARRLRDHLTGHACSGLLVFDNAADPDLVRELLPGCGGIQVVITSTDRTFLTLGAPVDLTVFTRAESIRYLHQATGLADDHGAGLLAEDLGDLPLALSAAAATIVGRRLDYGSYRTILTGQPLPRVLGRKRGHDHPLPVDRAIRLSLDTVETPTDDPELAEVTGWLLGVLAMLSPAGVRRTLLPDRDGRLDEALERCADASLLSWSAAGDAILMHRLVARVIRERAGERGDELVGAALDVIEPHLFDVFEAWQRRAEGSQLVAHIEAVWDSGLPESGPAEVLLRTFTFRSWVSRQLNGAVDMTRAIAAGEQELADSARLLGADHPHTLLCRNNLGMAYRGAGLADAALDQHGQALAVGEKVWGPDDPATLRAHLELAETLEDRGHYGEAIAHLELALDGYLRVRGEESTETLVSRTNLARTYQSAGRIVEAIALFEQVLTVRERILGDSHADTLLSRNNLAGAYSGAGRNQDAIALYERTLTDCETWLGADHLTTLTTRNNLAMVYHATARSGEAVGLLERTLASRERIQGVDHPATLACRGNLGLAYQGAGQLAQAMALQVRTLSDCERLLGEDHPFTLSTRNNLAFTYQSTGRFDAAIALHTQTLANRERLFGADHPQTLKSRNNLAVAQESAGHLRAAIELYEQTLADMERALGEDNPSTINTRNNLAHAYRADGRHRAAIELFERTLADCERYLDADAPLTQAVRHNLETTRASGPAPGPEPSPG